jgi:hypothetical protein
LQSEKSKSLTSLLLLELPANAFLKFACGSLTRVFPESTTQPAEDIYNYILVISKILMTRQHTSDDNEDQDKDLEDAQSLFRRSIAGLDGRNVETNVHDKYTKSRRETM